MNWSLVWLYILLISLLTRKRKNSEITADLAIPLYWLNIQLNFFFFLICKLQQFYTYL